MHRTTILITRLLMVMMVIVGIASLVAAWLSVQP